MSNRNLWFTAIVMTSVMILSTLAGCFSDPDMDSDSVPDEYDNCIDIVNHDQTDTDSDGQGDACDEDDDGDGVEDESDAFPLDPNETEDSDRDGVGDNADEDRDGDDVENAKDIYPEDPERAHDTDSDGIADRDDEDDDGDGIPDSEDNFRLTAYSPINQPGPFNVGTLDTTFTSPTGRELVLQIWYPTQDTGDERIIYDRIFPGMAIDDAEPDCRETRPVFMFSHGNTGIRWQSAFLMQWLASHGFVVAAPDHLHNTMLDFDGSRFIEVQINRPIDISSAFDWLMSKNDDSRSDLQGCFDESEGYIVGGHSFGGYTSLMLSGATISLEWLDEMCEASFDGYCQARDLWLEMNPDSSQIDQRDSRVNGALLLAPWNGGVLTEGVANVSVPTMILTGVEDSTTNFTHVTTIADYIEDSLLQFAALNQTGHSQFSPIACAAGWCSEPIELDLVLDFTNLSALWFFADLLDWPRSDETVRPEAEFVNWVEASDS